MPIELDRERFIDMMQEQASIGETEEGGLHRLALSDSDREVRDWFVAKLEEFGLEYRIDEFGNIFGRLSGTDPDAEPVLLGSHLDSQPDGGIYDGALGVIAALEFIRTLQETDIKTEHPIEIVNWTNEEGSRFQPAMQGSGVWAGVHDIEAEYEKTDEAGRTLLEELERIGYRGEVSARPREPYHTYLELHVEQGPYLEERNAQVGVVTGIVGFTWGALVFKGEADHSGPTPMHHRNDALVAAADVVTQVRRIPGQLGERTVGTVGYLDVRPNSINVIPGDVEMTWDFRDPQEEIIERARDRVLAEAENAAEREGVEWEYEDRMWVNPVDFSDRVVNAVETASRTVGYDCTRLVSGAGHDAQHLTEVTDAGMVFAVSEDGKSHSPAEHTSWDDCYAAANTFANAALELAGPSH
jgi:N-carbamoyl-L-amino-acid hydrolase